MIEQQARYVVDCVQVRRRRGLAALEVRKETMQRWREECEAKLSETVWASRCRSWYKNEAGRITNNWPYSTPAYWWRLRNVNLSDYVQHAFGGRRAGRHTKSPRNLPRGTRMRG